MRVHQTVSFILMLALTSCGDGGGGNTVTNDSSTPPAQETFSYRKTTEADLNRIQTLWAQRDLSVKELNLVYEDTQPNYYLRIYRHRVGNNIHFGAIVTPTSTLTKPLPVVVLPDGLDQSNPSINLESYIAGYASDSVWVVPAFRGRTLRYKNQSYFAEGDFCDAYDGAADDTIAFMNVTETTTPQAKMDKVLVMGYSRGGNTAMLLAERDKRVETVIAGAGPMDFYRQQVRDLYGSQYICQFISGKTAEQSRERMLASSPLLFTILPSVNRVYLLQGSADQIVPKWNAAEMNSHLINQKANVNLYLYDGYGHGDLWQNQNFRNTWSKLLADFISSH